MPFRGVHEMLMLGTAAYHPALGPAPQSGAAPAHAAVRGNPNVLMPLTFARVEPLVIPKKSLTGDNTERVDTRVLQVIYQVNQDEPALFVGMQVDVFLDGDCAR